MFLEATQDIFPRLGKLPYHHCTLRIFMSVLWLYACPWNRSAIALRNILSFLSDAMLKLLYYTNIDLSSGS